LILKFELFNFRFDIPIWDPSQAIPFLTDNEQKLYQEELNEKRKLRILMRGIKIGRKKGGARVSLMNVFEKKSDKPNEEQAAKET
jgi:hypothetical protein